MLGSGTMGMKSHLLTLVCAMAACLGGSAHAQGFASYGAYLPTHPEAGGYGYWYAAAAAAQAQPRRYGQAPDYDAEYPGRSGWRRGQYLPPEDRIDPVDDYADVRLPTPPRGYAWYRDADDYVLAAASSGWIAAVINDAD